MGKMPSNFGGKKAAPFGAGNIAKAATLGVKARPATKASEAAPKDPSMMKPMHHKY